VLALPLAAGWAVATWLALTMHGWWWPGRQVVVVLPLLVLAVAWWAGRVPVVAGVAAVLGVVGAVGWLWVLAEVVLLDDRRLIIDFADTTNPVSRLWRLALPELRTPLAGDWLRYAGWAALAGAAAVVGWRSVASGDLPTTAPSAASTPVPDHQTERIPTDAVHA
jgi:hypothetical protein